MLWVIPRSRGGVHVGGWEWVCLCTCLPWVEPRFTDGTDRGTALQHTGLCLGSRVSHLTQCYGTPVVTLSPLSSQRRRKIPRPNPEHSPSSVPQPGGWAHGGGHTWCRHNVAAVRGDLAAGNRPSPAELIPVH